MYRRPRPAARAALHAAFALLAVAVAACGGAGPRDVIVNEDACAYCRMTVVDPRYAAEVVTSTGRVHVFDSVDCLASYVRAAEAGTVATVWVTDANRPGTFIEADKAGFLVDAQLKGPMGRSIAFADAASATDAQGRFGGKVVTWASVLADTTLAGVH